MPNTPGGLPYPGPTDPVSGTDDAFKALAEAVEVERLKLPAGELLRVSSSGTTTATTSTAVVVAGINGATFTLLQPGQQGSRKVRIEVHAQTVGGNSGLELAKLALTGPLTRHSQVQINSAGGPGQVSTSLAVSGTLTGGQTYTLGLALSRVASGSSVYVADVQLVVLDLGAA